MMLTKQIQYGTPCTLACDGQCDKAWGINGRPRHDLPGDSYDDVYLADDVLGTAPGPGETACVSEGSDMKPSATPLADGQRMNKWCARECERSTIAERGEALRLPDMLQPKPNLAGGRAFSGDHQHGAVNCDCAFCVDRRLARLRHERATASALTDELDNLDMAAAHIRAAQSFTEGKLVAADRAQTATNDLEAALRYIEKHRLASVSACPHCGKGGSQ